MKKVYLITHSEKLNGTETWIDWVSCVFSSKKKAFEHLAFYEQIWRDAGEHSELLDDGKKLYRKNDKAEVFEEIVERIMF